MSNPHSSRVRLLQATLLAALAGACNESSPDDGGGACDHPTRTSELAELAALGSASQVDTACGDDSECELVPLDTVCSRTCVPAAVSAAGAAALREKRDALEAALCFDGEGEACPAQEVTCAPTPELRAECRDFQCVVAAPSIWARIVTTNRSDMVDVGYFYDDPQGRRSSLVAVPDFPYVRVPINASGRPELAVVKTYGGFTADDIAGGSRVQLSSDLVPGNFYTLLVSEGSGAVRVFDEQREKPNMRVSGEADLWFVNTMGSTHGLVGAVGIAGSFCLALSEIDPELPVHVTGVTRDTEIAFFARKEGDDCVEKFSQGVLEGEVSLGAGAFVFDRAPFGSGYLVVLSKTSFEPIGMQYESVSAWAYPLH